MKKLLLLLSIGFTFASCEKEKKECPSATEKSFALTGFTKITAAETFSVTVTKGTTYSIKAKGCVDDLADLALEVKSGGVLDVHYNHYKNDRYKVDFEIMMPALTGLNISGAATVKVTGLGGQPTLLRTVLSGTAKCTVDGSPIKIEADNSGTSVLTLLGNLDELTGSFSGDAKLSGYTAITTRCDLHTSGTAKAYIMVGQNLIATATGASRIYYKGNPSTVQVQETGTGKVIHE